MSPLLGLRFCDLHTIIVILHRVPMSLMDELTQEQDANIQMVLHYALRWWISTRWCYYGEKRHAVCGWRIELRREMNLLVCVCAVIFQVNHFVNSSTIAIALVKFVELIKSSYFMFYYFPTSLALLSIQRP